MHFVGVPSVHTSAAMRSLPRTDEVEILGKAERHGMSVARDAWLRDHGKQAGEMRLTPHEGLIRKLVVTFG